MPLLIRRTTAEATRPLRQAVLRPHQPLEASRYPGDEHALHLEAVRDGAQLGVASLYDEGRPDGPRGWRLRGMAVTPDARGSGVGRALLEACVAEARALGAQELWCNARSTAAGFYRRMGFAPVGPEFELPGIGPHFVMVRPL